jgi:ABC-2 type transport system permease protein
VNALLRAELAKIRATPSTWWLLLATTAIGVVGTLAPLIAAEDNANLLSDHKLQEAMHGAAAGSLLVIVVGIIGLAGEWRFGQATQTFLTTPLRSRVVAAKTVAYMGVGAVYGIVSCAAASATAWAWYRADDLTLPFHRSAVWLTLFGCFAVSVVFGVVGVAIGGIVRNQVVGIVGAVAWLALVEPALFAASPSAFKWLPGMASFSVRRQPTDGLLAVAPATAVLVVVVAALLAAALRLVDQDDVTA